MILKTKYDVYGPILYANKNPNAIDISKKVPNAPLMLF